ncbi:Dihydropyrimidine dehydrogenase (NADP+) [Anaerovibrio sp. JC8]|uniref:NAD-dependent dihydropyrimidine dehydrogenase subunit PreA n=1 Tax=Anaerovibrio sp. JC8 TaxID=1240085 RepID=UPI000A09717C|nr:NAD-dependent dihydropyrimidine dehydrogenase subunit PreA [Anaerovibrio sp. JC8]ORT99361.1 Dihydropyrimidine dehydrogenase (NADP+) [Anaerovibrio sp. JC8]
MYLERKHKCEDMLRCTLCADAPCDQACPKKLEPAKQLRSIWFDNEIAAASGLPETNPCSDCTAPCEAACIRSGEVPIKQLLSFLTENVRPALDVPSPQDEAALQADICGVPLENPFLLSSSVVGSNYDMCARAFEAGWAGVAFKTICSFEIHEASPRYSAIHGANGGLVGFKNIEQLSDHSVPENMEIFRRLKKNYPTKRVIASIMGRNEQEWEDLARQCQENGADVIELNFSCPNMMDWGLGSDIGQVPELVERFTAAARRGASIPILAKLTPNVDHMSPAAEAAKRGGADGLAAINTIKSIMEINPHTFVSSPAIGRHSAVGGYSGSAVKPIALHFIAELGHNQNLSGMHISGMGGVETWRDALEFILLGAGSVQVTTAIMQYGYRIIDDLKAGLNYYLHEKGYHSVKELIGEGLEFVSDTTEILERDSIVYPKFKRKTCIGCGRCQISCADGGHQAIHLDKSRRPVLDPKRCVGCHLCVLICPTHSIVSSGKRIYKKKI